MASKTEVPGGEAVKFTCSGKELPDAYEIFIRFFPPSGDYKLVFTGDSSRPKPSAAYKTRISVQFSDSNTVLTVTVNNFQIPDGGKYDCQADLLTTSKIDVAAFGNFLYFDI